MTSPGARRLPRRQLLMLVALLALALVVLPASPAAGQPPSNDDFAAATVITELPYAVLQSTRGATIEPGEPSFPPPGDCGELLSSVWFRYTPTETGTLVVSTRGSDLDTLVQVYTGDTLASLEFVGCHGDINSNVQASRFGFLAQAGTTYHVQVGGEVAGSGTLQFLTWRRVPAPPTCADVVAAPSFPDVDPASVHVDSIRCAAGLGLFGGRSDGRFDPGGVLTRGQLASVLVRALEASDIHLPEGLAWGGAAVGPHASAIRKLLLADVVSGRSGGFAPQQAATRGQVATGVFRASGHTMSAYPRVEEPLYEDVGRYGHGTAINPLTVARVVRGLPGGDRFGPNQAITRAQAASLFVRWLEDQAARLG